MADQTMQAQMAGKDGFIAALDQSGGSTPGALRQYGVPDSAYSGDAQMFGLIHDMRVRIITAPPFNGEKVIAAILFERTMDGEAGGKPVPHYLWHDRGVVPLLKVDKGLEADAHGVQMMKPMPDLDALLGRAAKLGVYGTKMRSVIKEANKDGIAAIVRQQFEVGQQITGHGLVPILEPEVSIKSPTKAEAEVILKDEIMRQLNAMGGQGRVMLKLTIPEQDDLYEEIAKHPKVERVVALSGGYSLEVACDRLRRQHGMIASFSRALIDGLRADMDDAAFNAALGGAIDRIYDASAHKA